MKFTVQLTDGSTNDYSGGASYPVSKGGVLTILDEGMKTVLSPTGWQRVDSEDHEHDEFGM